MLSLHLRQNLEWLGDGEEIIEYIDRPDVQELYSDLFVDQYGEPRFHILDERDGSVDLLEKTVERLVSQY